MKTENTTKRKNQEQEKRDGNGSRTKELSRKVLHLLPPRLLVNNFYKGIIYVLINKSKG